MTDLLEIRQTLINFWYDLLDPRNDNDAAARLSVIIKDLDDKIAEYDRYMDEMAFAHEQYEDRLVGA